MIFKKLSHQLFFITMVPLVFIVAITFFLFLMDSLSSADKGIQQRGQYILKQARLLSEFYFFTGNRMEMKKIAELIIQDEDIEFIKFSDKNKADYVFLKRSEISASKVFEATVFNRGLVIDDYDNNSNDESVAEVLGFIAIGLSDDEALSRKKSIYAQITLSMLLAIATGLIITYIFSRQLLLGLNTLKNSAELLEKNQLNERCDENGTGELLKIQEVFNSMAESVQQNEKTLNNKIILATESLEEKLTELSEKNIELDKTRKIAIDLERSKAVVDERARIMKDMHDGIGGQLIASLALIENEKDSVIKASVTEILEQCVDDLRLIINSLNVNANVLSALLADFKYRMSKRLEDIGITLLWEVQSSADTLYLQPQQSLNILRILQEAFTNVIKHANATQINFSTLQQGQHLIIKIEDNGYFNQTSDDIGEGIKNMISRASQLGILIDISQSENKSCCIVLSMPLPIFDKQPKEALNYSG